ncbi:2,3-diaminopropionate biosynthesis protein SbnA [Streptomyces sp. NPDC020965]|uniref:2,3-diaminopropionate biosynthesis protein SbnA n=1 Tax=Streptomyces sp. NPDC020965 TaxID=3365105 RepID=UPI00379B251A
MPVITTPQEFDVDDLFVDLRRIFGRPLYLKCEGFNFAGSIKLRAAREMVDSAERAGLLRPGMTLVESSSGNLGVALTLVAASRGYGFVCVTDSRCTHASQRLMRRLGAEVQVVTEPHPERGLLGARLERVARLCAAHADFHWLNQYTNPGNWQAHYRTTGPQIAKAFPDLDVLFVGAGTTGTLMGCARFFKETNAAVTVVGIDAVGSVNFGGEPGTRMIPGLGTSVRPAILDESVVDDTVLVSETDTVRTCHALLRHGFLLGGSTGSVVSGALRWLAGNRPGTEVTAVAVAPDLGERYLDTVYHDAWVRDVYGPDVLDHAPDPVDHGPDGLDQGPDLLDHDPDVHDHGTGPVTSAGPVPVGPNAPWSL